MKSHRRAAFLLGALLLAGSAFARQLPNIDAFANAKPNPANDAAVQARARNFIRGGSQVRSEGRLGVPTFLWAGSANVSTVHLPTLNGTERPEEVAARQFVGGYASLYNLNASDVTTAVVQNVHNTGKGGVIVKFKQRVGGIEIFREELNVLMTQKLDLVALSGYISSNSTPAAVGGSLGFSRDNRSAASDAFADLTGRSLGSLVAAGSRGGYDFFTAGAGAGLDEPIRVKKVYFHVAGGLVPAYYVEVAAKEQTGDSIVASDEAPGLDFYSYVISAADGSILFRKNLTSDAKEQGKLRSNGTNDYVYRVWASNTTYMPDDEPIGNAVTPKINPNPDGAMPPYVSPTDVTLTNYPFFSRAATDPWLAPGATVTNGNNVDAYVDLDGTAAGANDGLTGSDFRTTITAPNQFLHTFDPTIAPTSNEQRQAALQQLFFDTNFLHDWYYDSGFDEAAGNAQASNFGRGGVEGDSMRAEGQDGSGRNNANMSTPADGGRPRMQMYVFDALLARYFEVSAPANIAGKRQVGVSQLGPQIFDVTAGIVYAQPANACTALTNAAQAAGKIVIYERTTTCNFGTAFLNVQAANPAAIVMANLQSTPDSLVNITGASAAFTKPWLIITWNMAQPIKTEFLNNVTITGRARRDGNGIDRDGTIDNQVIFHEWGHYISNRLIADAAGLGQAQGRGMGEGWGDFNSMMLSVRPDDVATPSNANWNGTYGMASYVTSGDDGFGNPNDGLYWGIRRYPYSTDMTKNPLTFQHIQNGVALPVGPPVGFGASGSNNSEVHNVGEVWASMLWECYAALLRDTVGATPRLTFQQAQDRMKSYYVASLKLTPPEPTMLEARDAVLAAAYANDGVDYVEFWQAFAKRGMGVGAVGPDRYSVTHVASVTQSFLAGSDLQFVGATVDDSVTGCDADGFLDSNETGKLTFTLRNLGTQTLSNTTGTVTSSNPNVTFPNGNAITFLGSEGSQTTTGSVNVSLAAGSPGVQTLDFTLNFTDSALSVPGNRTASGVLRTNVNLIPASTSTDDVEAPTTAWTPSGFVSPGYNNFFPWRRVATTGMSHQWYAPDVNGQSDQRLTSPVFTVNGGGSVNIQFDHSFSFEFDASANYDGGKVEMSVNGGAYADVNATVAAGGYNGSILAGGAISGPGFVKNSGGTIHSSLTAAIAPGSTVQFRFRAGSDSGVGAFGWTVDNIAITGVVETPFTTIVADPGCASATTTTVSASPNPSTFGTSVTITAHVAALVGGPTSGTVTFKDGATTLGSSSLGAGGNATLNTSALSVGLHSLTAQYAGAPGFQPSNSATYTLQVNKATTTIVLGSSANPAAPGSSVTFTATISSPSGTPAGSITFLDGATPLGSVVISGGVATFTTSSLSSGSHSITATFAATASFSGTTSNTVTQVIANATSLALSSNNNPAAVGSSVTITATLTSPDAATGTIQFYDGMSALGAPVSVVGNAAAYTTSAFSVGSHPITASYSGDLSHLPSSASVLNQVVGNLPVISFASATMHVVEGSGTVHVTVNRTGDTTNASSVQYAMADAGAVNGTDYTAASGTLNFIAGATTGTIDVVLSADDLTAEIAKKFTITISSPSNATLGATTQSTVTILDNDGHIADFNGDKQNDIVLRNYTTAATAVWTLNNGAFVSIVNFGQTIPNTDYHIVGETDFNGDGKADVLWRNPVTGANAIWLMNGVSLVSVVNLPSLADPNMFVGGTGDMNGDGKMDIIWQNHSTGQVSVWLMNGTTFALAQTFSSSVPATYNVAGVGDFNYDGKNDILFRNYTNGANAVWLMNGLGLSASVNLQGLSSAFRFEGVADVNNDGSADIIIKNYSTGVGAVWLMDGVTVNSIVNLPTLGAQYEINGPR